MRTLHDIFQVPPLANEILLVLIVAIAALVDLRTRRIPNWLTVSGAIVAIGLNWFLFDTAGLKISGAGLGLAFGIYFILYLLKGMGAGDVKLMAAIGAVVGPVQWFGILIVTSIASIVFGVVLVAAKGRFRKTLHNIGTILTSLPRGRAPYKENPELDVRSEQALRMPHAVLIAFGTVGFLIAATLWAPR